MKSIYNIWSKNSYLVVLAMLVSSFAFAQERLVSGKVADESGSAMPGVNVILKGTSTGTATDTDGNFSISVPNDQAVLIFTFVGYASSEVTVGGKSNIDVQMAPDVTTFSEVVVTGYQVQR